ncbi:MAG TPA: ATP-grasp fold amidoligase family protein [bacterium]|nr:ATP-grasp fold amidoligase family protein [bacterium]
MAKLKATIKERIKDRVRFIKKNPYLAFLLNEKKRLVFEKKMRMYSDEEYIRLLFRKSYGREPNLENPLTFNEKLQWLKLYYRDERMAVCADKFEVRGYLEKLGYGHLLNTLYGVYENPFEIDIDKLPENFVLKATHGSGWNIICRDKSAYDWKGWKLVMKSWLRQNLYYYGREWVYKNMKPRLICEKYLDIPEGKPFDYKFFCTNGIIQFIQVLDYSPNTFQGNLYDTGWNMMKEKYAVMGSPKNVSKPSCLDEMLKIAGDLSSAFPFARVDLYQKEGKVIFGEITFFPGSGFFKFEPENFDLELGGRLRLPEKNFDIKNEKSHENTIPG